ncbi:hypothetical protein TraAM80_03942 [Trypanosoma rangeli]|uniref:Uncharacterized protein n=1 Tax=Trypanosoma rangeli TaxID=5698 RepID=A0A3R7L2M8_TRYRA|nr:uncharacterized protein TraAM80_03942 [Trypanosoma rangeli]RNF06369.1 hypothetical protein TraAM80_03942 [Trypanosoma rangeli]|eukprot:RNF06369.1 hypothetical protein TraAM80_03942 [Trypanosoma rangeli]
MWSAPDEAGRDGCISLFAHSSAVSRRLYLLAAALSIPPDRLLRYTIEVQRRGAHQHHRRAQHGRLGVTAVTTVVAGTSTTRPEAGMTAETETPQEFPLLLHGILSALVLPFSNLESSPAVSATASTKTKTIEPVKTYMKQGSGKSLSRQKGGGSRTTPGAGGTSAVSKDVNSGGSQHVNMHKHFAALEDMVVSQRVREPGPKSQTGISTILFSSKHTTTTTTSNSGGSSTSSTSSSSSSSGCCSDDVEASSVSASSPIHKGKAESSVAAPKKASKAAHSHVYELRQTPPFHQEVSIAQLLSELAEPFFASGGHAIGMSSGSGGSESRSSDVGYSMDLQQCMRLIPQELRTAAGVSRVSELYPPFMPLLLEALLKESVHESPFGLAARCVVMRLIELSAPIFVSRFFKQGSGASVDVGNNDKEEQVCHAMTLRATQRLANTAVALLEVIEDPVWVLDLSGALIASQLLHPGALRTVLHRRALDLAKLPPLWKPTVALAYCLVTQHSLHAAVRAEAELGAVSQPAERLSVSSESGSSIDVTAVVGSLPQYSHTSTERCSGEAAASPPLPEQEPHLRHEDSHPSSQSRRSSVSVEAGSCMPSDVGLSVALMGRAASLQQSSGTDVEGALPLRWLFPEKVPPVVTLPNSIVMTCMVLCAGALGRHTVVALGQWCLRSLRALPATPCAVGLTHLMLKYPQFLKKASLRVSSGLFLSSSATTAAVATAVAAVTSSTKSTSSHGNGKATTLFCIAVFMEGCQLANTVMLRQANLRMDGRLAMAWQRDTASSVAAEEGHLSDFAETPYVHEDSTLHELREVQCYLVMLLQALVMRSGVQLPTDAQGELFALFVTTARLRVAVGAPKEEGLGAAVGCLPAENGSCQAPQRTLSQVALKLVDESFGAVARAVDILLHDYDAGCPRQLCESLVSLLPPQNTLFSELQRVGAWEKHLDCLETVQAAAEAYREARRSTLPRPSSQEEADFNAAPSSFWSSVAAHDKDALPRPMSLLELQQELEWRAKRAVVAVRSGAEVMFGSLVSVLPCSGEPLCLATTPDGGLPVAQQLWWVEHTIVYLVEEWWRSRVSAPALFHFSAEDTVETSSSDVFRREAQKSFIRCCPNPI